MEIWNLKAGKKTSSKLIYRYTEGFLFLAKTIPHFTTCPRSPENVKTKCKNVKAIKLKLETVAQFQRKKILFPSLKSIFTFITHWFKHNKRSKWDKHIMLKPVHFHFYFYRKEDFIFIFEKNTWMTEKHLFYPSKYQQ